MYFYLLMNKDFIIIIIIIRGRLYPFYFDPTL